MDWIVQRLLRRFIDSMFSLHITPVVCFYIGIISTWDVFIRGRYDPRLERSNQSIGRKIGRVFTEICERNSVSWDNYWVRAAFFNAFRCFRVLRKYGIHINSHWCRYFTIFLLNYLCSLQYPIHRLANMSQDIMSAPLFYQLLMCASIIALNLFVLSSASILSFDGIVASYEVLIYGTLTFIYCYLSDTITSNLYEIGDSFFGCAWYFLPVQQQRLFIFPIERSHRRFHLTGFSLVDCSLRNFLSVLWYFISIQIFICNNGSMFPMIYDDMIVYKFSREFLDYSNGVFILFDSSWREMKHFM